MHNSLPFFFIVGAAKSGTTSLADYLGNHPNILKPKVKEPRFFVKKNIQKICDDDPMKNYILKKSILNEVEYFRQFSSSNKEHLMSFDASVFYLYYYKEAIPQIKKMVGDVPIIIMLRNPVDRAISNINFLKYWHNNNIKKELELENFRVINNYNPIWYYKQLGLYSEQVKAYLDNFSKVKIILFENFKKDPKKIYDEVVDFLSLNHFNLQTFNKSNVTTEPNKVLFYIRKTGLLKNLKKVIPLNLWNKFRNNLHTLFFKKSSKDISPNDKNNLISFYSSDIDKLEKILNMNLSKWRKY